MKKLDITEMPPKSGESMERVTIRIPDSLLKKLEAIAERKGTDVSSVIRQTIEEGIPGMLQKEAAELEYENKQLVNRKLKLSIAQLEPPDKDTL